MTLFSPHNPESELVTRQAVIGELSALANALGQESASSSNQAVIITYAKVIDRIADRIEGIRRGDPLRTV